MKIPLCAPVTAVQLIRTGFCAQTSAENPTRKSIAIIDRQTRCAMVTPLEVFHVDQACRSLPIHLPNSTGWFDHGTVLSTAHEQRSEEHTSELQSRRDLVCRLLLEKKKKKKKNKM